ncbi:MAG TPA: hypothetical protein VGM37_09095 [Armatimonadota bacterium]|jgi:hypothetical protein
MYAKVVARLVLAALIDLTGALAASQVSAPVDVSAAVGGVLVSPLSFRLAGKPGQNAALEVDASVPGTASVNARMEVLQYVPESGTYRAQFGVQNPQDAAGWFAARDNTVNLRPGERHAFVLKYSVPRSTRGCYYCMVRLTPKPAGSVTGLSIVYEIPVVFFVGRQASPLISIASPILEAGAATAGRTEARIAVPISNDGDGFAVIGATGEVRNLRSGRIVKSVSDSDRNLFPRTKRNLFFSLGPLSDGLYRASFNVEVGTRRLPRVSADFALQGGQVKPLTPSDTVSLTPVVCDPPSFHLTIPAGAERTQVLRVTNVSQAPIKVRGAALPVAQAHSGSIGVADGALPPGLSVQVAPSDLDLQPGRSGSMRVTVGVDRGAEGDMWFGLAITNSLNEHTLAETILSDVEVSGTLIPDIKVRASRVEAVGKKPVAVSFEAENTGNQALRPVATAALLADGIQSVGALQIPVLGDGGILPGAVLPNTVVLPPTLRPGKYVVEVSYQYTATDFARLRVPITVPSERPAKLVKPAAKTVRKPVGKRAGVR